MFFELFEPFHVFSRGEESRDVQVDGVGLGFARGAEKTPKVTKVAPELARYTEISFALVTPAWFQRSSEKRGLLELRCQAFN